MSNKSIKKRIAQSIKDFKSGNIDLKALKDSIEKNGQALEMMPYSLIKELDQIEYDLTVSKFADEEDSYSNIDEVLKTIEIWLGKVPEENE